MREIKGIYAAAVSILNDDLSLDVSKTSNHCENINILQILKLIPGSSGSTGSSGNGVRNHGSDPPFHGQEFSDDGSSQQTPSK